MEGPKGKRHPVLRTSTAFQVGRGVKYDHETEGLAQCSQCQADFMVDVPQSEGICAISYCASIFSTSRGHSVLGEKSPAATHGESVRNREMKVNRKLQNEGEFGSKITPVGEEVAEGVGWGGERGDEHGTFQREKSDPHRSDGQTDTKNRGTTEKMERGRDGETVQWAEIPFGTRILQCLLLESRSADRLNKKCQEIPPDLVTDGYW